MYFNAGLIKTFCFTETQHLRSALDLLYQVINKAEISEVVTQAHKSTFSPRIKAYNLAMAGLPDSIAILLEWMKDPEYALFSLSLLTFRQAQ